MVKKVLAIDGGGIRGLIAAIVISKMQEVLKKPAYKLFDIISGTSTGAILALVLTTPQDNDNNQPKYSSEDLTKIYQEHGSFIFKKPFWKFGILNAKYNHENLEKVLDIYFGENKFNNCLQKTIITAYETSQRTTKVFKSWYDESSAILTKDIGRCSSAAPTYFDPKELTNKCYIDGGIYANNSALCGYAEAKKLFPGEQIKVFSIGNGKSTRPLTYDQIKGWGAIRWVRPLIDMLFDSSMQTVDHVLGLVLGADYHRLQTELLIANDNLDDASPKNIADLMLEADKIIHSPEFAKMISFLD